MTFRQRLHHRLLRYVTEGADALAVPAEMPATLDYLARRLAVHPASLRLTAGRWLVRWPQGVELYYSTKFNSVSFSYLDTGHYEDAELRLFQQNLQPDSVVMDIGANVGLYSLLAAQIAHAGKVFSFEPLPDTHRELRENIDLNHAAHLVEPIALALSDHTGEGFITSDYHSSNFIVGAEAASAKQRIELSTLDQFAADRALDRVDFIKIDVEGHELATLRGATALLRRHRPMLLVELIERPMEFNERAVSDHRTVLALLAELGYAHHVVDDRGQIVPGQSFRPGPADRSYHNYLFYIPGHHRPNIAPSGAAPAP